MYLCMCHMYVCVCVLVYVKSDLFTSTTGAHFSHKQFYFTIIITTIKNCHDWQYAFNMKVHGFWMVFCITFWQQCCHTLYISLQRSSQGFFHHLCTLCVHRASMLHPLHTKTGAECQPLTKMPLYMIISIMQSL